MRKLKEHNVKDNKILGWKGNDCSPSLPWQGGLLQCLWQIVNRALLLFLMVTGAYSFVKQGVLWNSMESAHILLNRNSWDSHPLLLASKATHKKFTHFHMTTLQIFENNNLVPLQTSLLLVTQPEFLQNGENLAILDYLLNTYANALFPGFYIISKFPVIIHITDRDSDTQGI